MFICNVIYLCTLPEQWGTEGALEPDVYFGACTVAIGHCGVTHGPLPDFFSLVKRRKKQEENKGKAKRSKVRIKQGERKMSFPPEFSSMNFHKTIMQDEY